MPKPILAEVDRSLGLGLEEGVCVGWSVEAGGGLAAAAAGEEALVVVLVEEERLKVEVVEVREGVDWVLEGFMLWTWPSTIKRP